MKNLREYSQRFILGSFVVLWIGVLPWLCWGGWSNPHHPHASPHFVFAVPPLYGNDHHVHPNDPHNDQEPLAGVAHPDTLLITLLALLVPVSRMSVMPRTHRFIRKATPLWMRFSSLTVPTPPPRMIPSNV
jgi:hypothetical protein